MTHLKHKAKAITPEGEEWRFGSQLNTFLTMERVMGMLVDRAVTLYWKRRSVDPSCQTREVGSPA